jgi:Zn-finger nucleic acid-binding protein
MTKSTDDAHTPIDCPKCHARMEQVDVDGVVVDRCPDCGGLFLDPWEKEFLLALKERAERVDTHTQAEGRRTDVQARITCPRDQGVMVHIHDIEQAHVGMERCSVCGAVFLDAGELKDLTKVTLGEKIRRFFG